MTGLIIWGGMLYLSVVWIVAGVVKMARANRVADDACNRV